MDEKNLPLSEAEELDSLLDELAADASVREIAGWRSGFAGWDRLLSGILPGFSLLVGPPACGKTTFVKQLCDQVAMLNAVPVAFCALGESKLDLRVRTHARLSGLENREIRKGRSFVLHSYGVPKASAGDADLPPSWRKLEVGASEARSWLARIYMLEGSDKVGLSEIREHVAGIMQRANGARVFIVIDDVQRLEAREPDLHKRLLLIADQLHGFCRQMDLSLLAVWPDFEESSSNAWAWGEKVPGANMVMVMANDPERSRKLTEPNRAINLYIVKNREGEKAMLQFDFQPAFSRFDEVITRSTP
jgi:replicative DNA helicase